MENLRSNLRKAGYPAAAREVYKATNCETWPRHGTFESQDIIFRVAPAAGPKEGEAGELVVHRLTRPGGVVCNETVVYNPRGDEPRVPRSGRQISVWVPGPTLQRMAEAAIPNRSKFVATAINYYLDACQDGEL